jgi:hypothetical protein
MPAFTKVCPLIPRSHIDILRTINVVILLVRDGLLELLMTSPSHYIYMHSFPHNHLRCFKCLKQNPKVRTVSILATEIRGKTTVPVIILMLLHTKIHFHGK